MEKQQAQSLVQLLQPLQPYYKVTAYQYDREDDDSWVINIHDGEETVIELIEWEP